MNRELQPEITPRAQVPPTPLHAHHPAAAHAEAPALPIVREIDPHPFAEARLISVGPSHARWMPEPELDLEPQIEKVSLDPSQRMKAFNGTTGAILAKAFEHFPQLTDAHPVLDSKTSGVDPDFFRANLKWLEQEGFIRFADPDLPMTATQGDHRLYTLTSKGLGVLTSPPASLQAHGESIGAAMVGAAKKGAKEGLQDLAKEALKNGLGFAARVAMDHMRHGG